MAFSSSPFCNSVIYHISLSIPFITRPIYYSPKVSYLQNHEKYENTHKHVWLPDTRIKGLFPQYCDKYVKRSKYSSL